MASKRPDPETLARLYADHTGKEIAKMYGVSPTSVRDWIKDIRKNPDRYGVDIPFKEGNKGRPSPNRKMPDPETLVGLYASHTAGEIAKMYGVAKGTVESWIKNMRRDTGTHGMDIPKKENPDKKMPDPGTLAKLYADHTAGEIAKMYGVKPATVRHWIADIRHDTKTCGTCIPEKEDHVCTMPDPKELARLYAEHTGEEIAGMYGVSKNTVHGWIHQIRNNYKRFGIRIPKKSEAGQPKKLTDPKELAELHKKHTLTEIADIYGVKKETISIWLGYIRGEPDMGHIPVPHKKQGKKPDMGTLKKLYADHTAAEIASIYGASPKTVRNWLLQAGCSKKDCIALKENA